MFGKVFSATCANGKGVIFDVKVENHVKSRARPCRGRLHLPGSNVWAMGDYPRGVIRGGGVTVISACDGG